MKKFLVLSVAGIMACSWLSGCSIYEVESKLEQAEDRIENEADKIEDKVESKTEKYDDDIAWEKVEPEYKKIEAEVQAEVRGKESFTKDEIKKLVEDIDVNYEKIKDGITADNEQAAKDMYRAACTLDEIEEKYPRLSDHEVTEFGDSAKDMVESLYNMKDNDYKEDKAEFERRLERIRNYTEENWTAVESMLK